MPSLTNIFTDIPPNVENIGPLVNQFKVKNICCIGAGYVGTTSDSPVLTVAFHSLAHTSRD